MISNPIYLGKFKIMATKPPTSHGFYLLLHPWEHRMHVNAISKIQSRLKHKKNPAVVAQHGSKWDQKIRAVPKRDKKNMTSWLVVWTPLKNISQLEWLFPIYGKIKNIPNHRPASHVPRVCGANIWRHPALSKHPILNFCLQLLDILLQRCVCVCGHNS